MTGLEHSIHKTVAWFSLFETPVTVFEMWKWMLGAERTYALEEVYAALEGEGLRGRLEGRDGFWTLAQGVPTLSVGNLQRLALERQARFLDATRKYAKLRRAARYFALLPTVESAAAANTLAWWNTREESDIDLFVRVLPGSVWATRLLMVAPFAILGKRPGATDLDPFCFSFFASTDAPPIASFALPGGDPYLELWEKSLVTVYRRDRKLKETRYKSAHLYLASFHFLLGHLESLARWIQMRRLPSRIKRVMNADSCVVVNDQVLKFHENDRREEYRERLHALCSEHD